MDPSPSPLTLVRAAEPPPSGDESPVAITVDRWRLAKLRWRATAGDGRDFGFDLTTPLYDGDAVARSPGIVYVIRQKPEPVLTVKLTDTASAAALAWNIGNLHQPLAVDGDTLIVPDDPAVRQYLDRAAIHYHTAEQVFQPLRSSGGHGHHHHHH